MWPSRVWFLLVLLTAAILVGVLVELPGVRDGAVTSARDQVAEREARLLHRDLQGALLDHRRVAAILGQAPALRAALDAITEEMPPHIAAALLSKALHDLSRTHRRYQLALFDSSGREIAHTGDAALAQRVASLDAIAAARKAGEAQSAALLDAHGQAERWVVATPVPAASGRPSATLAVIAGPPAAVLQRAHDDLHASSRLVVIEGGQLRGSPKHAPALLEATKGKRAGAPGAQAVEVRALQLDEQPFHAARWALPGSGGLSFVLAWPVDPPTTLSQALGEGPWLGHLRPDRPETLWAFALAAGVWLLGVLLSAGLTRRPIRRLASDLREAAGDPRGAALEPSRTPGWLRPVASAGVALVDALQQQVSAPPPASEPPPPEPPPEPAKPPTEPVSEPPAAISEPPAAISEPPAAISEPEPPEPIDSLAEFYEPPSPPGPTLESIDPLPPAAVTAERSSPLEELPPPALEEEEAEFSVDDGDIRLPLPSAPPPPEPVPRPTAPAPAVASIEELPPARQGESLLARLRSQGTLDAMPARRSDPARPSAERGDDVTAVGPAPQPATPDPDRTAVGPPPIRREPAPEVSDATLREVFEALKAQKIACGQSPDLDFKRFRAKLLRTRKMLMERFKCEDVQFRVYVKEGKAALKAAPVLGDKGA